MKKGNSEAKRWAELLISMSTDYLGGSLDERTYIKNLMMCFDQIYMKYRITILADLILKCQKELTP